MGRTFIRQDTQIRRSDVYNDTVVPSEANYETNPAHVEDDLNTLRSAVQNVLNRDGAGMPAGNWYDNIVEPSTFENGARRGVSKVNQDLHDLERKRVLVSIANLSDVTVPNAQNYVVLAIGELPTNTTAAVGAVQTRGTVAAHNAGFGAHSLAEVGGSTAISPKNFCEIVDGATRDPILSSGRVVYALFQTETATDGHTMTGTTPNRAQLSFVRINATGDDLEAVPAADIQDQVINYANVERKALEDLTEQDFLRGALVDVPAGSVVTRQVAYDNQGVTPVDVTTHSYLDLEGAGLVWQIRDDLEAVLFNVTEGSAGGTSSIQFSSAVDVFNNDAIANDFANGLKVDTAGVEIDIGVTAIANVGTIETTAGDDLRIMGTRELFLDDGNQAGSTWAQTSGIKLSEDTQEWDDYETIFSGEVSLLKGIVMAASMGARKDKVYANLTANVAADNDVGGVGGGANLDAQLPNMSLGTFLVDYDVFLNGSLLRPGADAAANNDYYPGTSLANGQLRFEFQLKGVGASPDVLCVIPYA